MSILERIKNSRGWIPPRFDGMEFIRYVEDTNYGGDPSDCEFAWTVYISHDPCHDSGDFRDDRNTVVAFHRITEEFRIIGRELPRDYAMKLIWED